MWSTIWNLQLSQIMLPYKAAYEGLVPCHWMICYISVQQTQYNYCYQKTNRRSSSPRVQSNHPMICAMMVALREDTEQFNKCLACDAKHCHYWIFCHQLTRPAGVFDLVDTGLIYWKQRSNANTRRQHLQCTVRAYMIESAVIANDMVV